MTNTKLFQELINKCETMVSDCGFTLPYIEYKLNNRLHRALGQCTKKSSTHYIIELSEIFFNKYIEHNELDKIENTLLHEMVHALPKCMNHGVYWQTYSDKIGTKFGYEIDRVATVDNVIQEVKEEKAKYVTECSCCNRLNYYYRKPKLWDNMDRYSCGKCGGKINKKSQK